MTLSYAVSAVMIWWLLQHPQVEQSFLDPAEIDQLVNSDFENYYSESAASHFAAQVWTNNAWVAAICIAFGVLGVPVLFVLWQNLLNLAMVGSIMIRHDRGSLFFGLILPHGLLELTAVFVAAGVGLRLFWSWVAPGTGHARRPSRPRDGRPAAWRWVWPSCSSCRGSSRRSSRPRGCRRGTRSRSASPPRSPFLA